MLRWVKLSERKPTEKDADYSDHVLVREWHESRGGWFYTTTSLVTIHNMSVSARLRCQWLEDSTEVTSVVNDQAYDGRMIDLSGE